MHSDNISNEMILQLC